MAAFRYLLGLGGLLLVALAAYGEDAQLPTLSTQAAGYAPAASCQGCHAEEAKVWAQSDHAWALRDANEQNVLGDFAGVRFSDSGVAARFFRQGSKFLVNTEGADGKAQDFEIRYTFGHYPLQQYLVAFPGGKLQALTIAWDSRAKEQGGQRWFSLYPGQRFRPEDSLHWTGRYQNWNAMCADCHSTNLQKHYDDQTDTFATTWSEQTVGCQACHGPAQAHVDWAANYPAGAAGNAASATEMGLKVDFKALGGKGLIEQCAFCHSRRQGLGVGQQPGHPLLDAALPATLRPDLYHADGQIQGEVYVYGSFTQSKMYAAGVTCTDCHDPHSSRVKLEGNALCGQCHQQEPSARFPGLRAKNYDSVEHHHHTPGSQGAQCVNCHMPATTYMGVDSRRDHSFRLPRPDLSHKTASPDACTRCHEDKDASWAATQIDSWFDAPNRPPHYGEALQAARQGNGDSVQRLAEVIGDLGKPEIVRATAAERLADLGAPAIPTLEAALQQDSALVRAYAIPAFAELPPVERVRRLLPLLDDDNRAVRDEALRALSGIPRIALPEARRASFQTALADYEKRLRGNADLPGNRLNLAVLLEREERKLEALEQYRMALRLDPYFAPARVNLATLANDTLRADEAIQVLKDGLGLPDMPGGDRGNLAYMLALLLVEHGQPGQAVDWMGEAAKALPDNPRIHYNHGLLLLQLQRRDEARASLEAGLALAPDDADLLYGLIFLHGSAGDRERAMGYARRMRQVAPSDPRLPAVLRQLGL